MSKRYIALFDEHKLIGDIFQHSLEKFHNYDILFGVSSERELFAYLTPAVKLLLVHIPEVSENIIRILQKVLRTFRDIKIAAYTPHPDLVQSKMDNFSERIVIFSVLIGSTSFFETLQEIFPDFQNSHVINGIKHGGPEIKLTEIAKKHEYKLSGFQKLKENRKWVLILKCLEEGMKPKEMEEITNLKWNTINSYLEQMQKCTGCRNQTELFWQAKKMGIL